jgi:hypothetical protein
MFESQWAAPAAGFRWADRRQLISLENIRERAKLGKPPGKPERYLVPLPSPGPPRTYDAFSSTALFRTFAAVEPTEAGVLQFANQYGWLGGPYSKEISEPDAIEPGKFWPGRGELLADWAREIRFMRHIVVDLLDNHKAGHARKLREFITWEQTKYGYRVFYTVPPGLGLKRWSVQLAGYPEEPLPTLQLGDTMRPTWIAILKLITAQMERYPISVRLADRSDAEQGSAALTLPTNCLIAALWFQLARSIADNHDVRRCAECGAYFDVTTNKRNDAQFCSPNCRLRAYRKRQKEETLKAVSSTRTSPRRKAK